MSFATFGIPLATPATGEGLVWDGRKYEPGTTSGAASALTGLTLNRVPFGSSSGGLQDSSSLTWDGTTFAVTGAASISTTLTVTGVATFTGGATFGSDAGAGISYTLNSAAGAERSIWWRTANVTRWKFYADSTAEGGADSGSDLILAARSDAGVNLGAVLTFTRAAGGTTTMSRPVAMSSSLNVTGEITFTGTSGASLRVTNGVANGAVVTALTGVGPTGAQTTVQGWLRISVAGTDRYIPFW